MYYATRFIAPDAFAYLVIRGKKYLLMSDLEVDRARSQAKVDRVFSISALRKDFVRKYQRKPGYLDIIEEFVKSRRVKSLTVPGNFPLEYADLLRKRRLRIQVRPDPFFTRRLVKTPAEIRYIRNAIRHTEKAVAKAIAVLRKSLIRRGKLYYQGKILTSERLKQVINVSLMESGFIASHSIVACGKHAVDPHNEGSGPIYANQSLIMDIFPRDSASRYFADFTRTVVRGKASPKLKKIYAAVREGQDIGFSMLREGINSGDVHNAIHKRFEALGFTTGVMNGRMQGFFHGTGHGLGLDIHEEPRVSPGGDIMKAGNVVTVEPGLYYKGIGGVRLEDVVVITKKGCINLTRAPKFLEI
ncbi:MAG: Xaa-Pro peptidase family protein [Candidatus Omnitrophota bacterium]|nr:Xaa-Pro peptidase family protein [Candidatus Omnitrophota bacterium]